MTNPIIKKVEYKLTINNIEYKRIEEFVMNGRGEWLSITDKERMWLYYDEDYSSHRFETNYLPLERELKLMNLIN